MAGQRQPVKIESGLPLGETDDDERRGRRSGIAAQPFGVVGADGFRQAIGAAQNIDRAVLAVIAGGDAEVRLLIGRQGVADLGNGAHEIVPAEFFAQVEAVAESVGLERAAGGKGKQKGADEG